MEHPYIVGSLWNGKDGPPEENAKVIASDKKMVDRRVIISRSGHIIELNDKQGEESITIMDKNTNGIQIFSKDNSMIIYTGKNMEIIADGKLDIKAKGKMSISSDADVTVQGMNLKLSATSGAQMQGNSKVDVTSGGIVSVKGSMTKIG
jgi:hypothetical protein